ncbi:hypothetical protein HZA55_04980 [Candidatus Poribacteria bacterium]|nr:hypothetical protein [Candidatus Poribacteria bacterium]
MKIEIFVLCDAATNYQNKLNILGTFDTIFSNTMPIIYPQCSVAVRFRFYQIEEGDHKISINITDSNGKSIFQPLYTNVSIGFGKDGPTSLSTNLILNIQGLKLDKFGEYVINLAIDNKQEATLPLYVKEISKVDKVDIETPPESTQYN